LGPFNKKGTVMRVAISSSGPDLDAEVDPRFGRCRCFVMVDPTSEAFEVLDNQAAMMSGGAGIQAAQMVANSGVAAVITGNVGPNAAETLAAAGMKTYLGVSGTVREALQQYKSGQLQKTSGSTVESHFGTNGLGGGGGCGRGMGLGTTGGRGMGCGRGGGSGRGMGMGRGMGRGRSMGRDMGGCLERDFEPDRQPAPANDLEDLKRQKDQLREQMNRIEERIRELGKKK
jgi:predicted Fe-Mo cluster-binding NifX family protein